MPDPECASSGAMTGAEPESIDTIKLTSDEQLGSPVPLGANESFGDYELLGEIARGGMGVVFKARQKSLNRIVAVKMIRSEHLSSGQREIKGWRAETDQAAVF